jgi:hypothetical protein
MLLRKLVCTVIGWVLVSNLTNQQVLAQAVYFEDTVTIVHEGVPLVHPATGGFNNSQLYVLDLYDDGVDDLAVFDRAGGTWSFFRRICAGTCYWQWNGDPTLRHIFPPANHWAVIAREPCHGAWLLFTDIDDVHIAVYRISHSGTQPQVEKIIDTLKFFDGQEMQPIYVNQIDIPGFADIDHDGDLDLLTFAPLGGFLEWFRNGSGACGEFQLTRFDPCFGEFFESGVVKEVTLDTCTTGLWAGGTPGSGLHSGSTVLPFDYDANGLYDVVLGDLSFNNLNLLLNDGELHDAHFFSQDIAFPSNSVPVEIPQFPAPFLFDVDGDGFDDLVAAPNSRNNSIDVDNIWFYANGSTAGDHAFDLDRKDLLVGASVDWGSYTIPARLDVNGDGLQDLVLAVGGTKNEAEELPGRLVLYLREEGPHVHFTLADSNFAGLTKYDFREVAVDFGDLNGDGLPDMVLGNAGGKLYYTYNAGKPDSAVYGALLPFSPTIDIGSNATPALADLDGDGLAALVVGERNGNLNFFRNTGTVTAPAFAATPDDDFLGEVDVRQPGDLVDYSTPYFVREGEEWVLYTGNLAGKVQKYDQISGNLQGAFHRVDDNEASQFNLPDIDEGARSAPLPIAPGSDDVHDLVIGNERGGIRISNAMQPSGVGDIPDERGLTIFPNPAGSHITVQWKGAEPATVEIFTIHGQLVYSAHEMNLGNVAIDIAQLPAGIYYVTLKSRASRCSRSFIKQ